MNRVRIHSFLVATPTVTTPTVTSPTTPPEESDNETVIIVVAVIATVLFVLVMILGIGESRHACIHTCISLLINHSVTL